MADVVENRLSLAVHLNIQHSILEPCALLFSAILTEISDGFRFVVSGFSTSQTELVSVEGKR